MSRIYRYQFNESVSLPAVEAVLVLAISATESLHGEACARLDAAHYLDQSQRVCIVDARTVAGRDLSRLFTGFLTRELGADSFKVCRVTEVANSE